MLSGDINGEAVQLIRQNSHRVLAKPTGDGEMIYCRLDDSDSNLYYDGAAATLDGTQGDVFMKLPQFYWKVTTESTDVFKIGLAYGGRPDDTWNEWDGNVLIGVYKGYVESSKLYSTSSHMPTVIVSQSNFKTYARNRGTGFRLVDWGMHCIMAMLYYCQYGHMNSQTKIGAGTSSYPKVTGATDSLGMTDTVGGGNGDRGSINFWGAENWWGDLLEWIDNVEVDSRVWKVTEPDGTERTAGTAGTSDGYTTKMLLGSLFDMIPATAGGNSIKGYCDNYYQTSSNSRVVLRSGNGLSPSGGISYIYAYNLPSHSSANIGARLAFRGTLEEAKSSREYMQTM